ncbi:MAG: helix-turn-helix domain-containing protein [Betaproteobacteria bacterium]|nr:helix-turn-helix domain-containing protein [Betaproteobacteria bacterium]
MKIKDSKIKCNLSRMMGERKLKVIDVAKSVGVHRNTITLLYNDDAQLIEIATLQKLCELFNCKPGDLLEYVPSEE